MLPGAVHLATSASLPFLLAVQANIGVSIPRLETRGPYSLPFTPACRVIAYKEAAKPEQQQAQQQGSSSAGAGGSIEAQQQQQQQGGSSGLPIGPVEVGCGSSPEGAWEAAARRQQVGRAITFAQP